MAAITQQYNAAILNIGNGKVNASTDTFKVMLVNNYTFNVAHNTLNDVLPWEIEEEAGYVSGGVVLQNTQWFVFGSNTQLTADSPSIAPVGTTLPDCTGAVVYSDTSTEKNLLTYIDFGETVSITVGNDLLLTILSDGIINVSRNP